MYTDFLLNIFKLNADKTAVIWKENHYSYSWLLERIDYWQIRIQEADIHRGSVIAVEGEYSPDSIAAFMALLSMNHVAVPFTPYLARKKDEYFSIAKVEYSIDISSGSGNINKTDNNSSSELIRYLRNEDHPGLILFSSGTTGKSKAAVHDMSRLLRKYHTKRKDFRTIVFMMYDHIGGVDTLLYSLSNASTIVITEDRSTNYVCRLIDKFKIQVLPVTPTFLNLLILSQDYEKYDLSSLEYITYGTEVMPEITLNTVNSIFPKVKILQKYGTTEVGTLRSKSKDSNSLWVKIGGEGYKTRVVDGKLQIKADSAMLGYLNAPSPFTEDGWFITGDLVEQQGDYLRILGRETDIINVGGEKVYPSEVENTIMQLGFVIEVSVFADKNPIMGNIVAAEVTIDNEKMKDKKELKKEIIKYCKQELENYKVPVKIKFTSAKQHTDRFKKQRTNKTS